MTKEEAIAYLEDPAWNATKFGLERTRRLLHLLGDPYEGLRFIHVAGSNGKGSTCAMLERILRSAGYRTGMFSSPGVEDYCEQIRIRGENIPGERLAELAETVRAAAETMEEHPTRFELLTALGMLYFAREQCDLVVLETGMGGALDSTNVIDAPEAAVITNIGLEHTEYLGDTLPEIASVKAGIIKPGCVCVCYPGDEEAVAVIKKTCEEKGVPFRMADFDGIRIAESGLEGQRFFLKSREYFLSLPGAYQVRNAAVALETVSALRSRGWTVPEEAVDEGLRNVSWPARMEVLGRQPLFLLDGGHNPQCAQAFAESLKELLPGRAFVFLTGVLADKDYPSIMRGLLPLAREFVCLTPENPSRALPGEKLAEYLRSLGAEAESAEDYKEGIMKAIEKAGKDGAVAAFGSLYMAGRVKKEYGKLC